MKSSKNIVLFAPLLQTFIKNYLIKERNVSPHTIESYIYTFYLLLEYAKLILKKESFNIELSDMNASLIRNFLIYLETERHIKPTSRNQRLAAIRSFFKYTSSKVPELAVEINQVLAIQGKKTSQTLVHFLTHQEVKALLTCQNLDTWIGRRDHNLILLAVETGLRLFEITQLTWRDIRAAEHYGYIRCVGKGRKERDVMLSRELSKVLKSWERETISRSAAGLIFPNVYGELMSADTFQAILKKYARQAIKQCPSLEGKKISPHVLRHTAAMNLRNAGADLLTIAGILGHKSVETTQIYLEMDIKRQEEVLSLLTGTKTKLKRFKPKNNLESFLESLKPRKGKL